MNLRTVRPLILLTLVLVFSSTVSAQRQNGPKPVVQYSTLDALLGNAVIDTGILPQEVIKLGDIGLGTFEALDGELVLLEGNVFQVKANSSAFRAKESTKVPYITATFLRPTIEIKLELDMTDKNFKEEALKTFSSKNYIYAFRIDGLFKVVEVRSVHSLDKPYPKSIDLAKLERRTRLIRRRGTIVGFWFPEFMKSLNSPGWHMHFITDDRKNGGHVLGFTVETATVLIEEKKDFSLTLPGSQSFKDANLTAVPTVSDDVKTTSTATTTVIQAPAPGEPAPAPAE